MKPILMTYCYNFRSEHLSIRIGGASSKWQVTQRSLTEQCAESEKLWSTQYQMGCLYDILLLGLGNFVEEEVEMF